MKIIIAAIAFLTTIGGLFLFDGRKPNTATDYAQIVKNISESVSPSVSAASNKIVKRSPVTSISLIPSATLTPSLTPSLAPTFIPTPSKTPIPTPTPTPVRTPLPSTPAPSSTPVATPLTTLAPTPSPVTIPTPSANQSGLININTANATELDKITGVGPAYAKNIIDYRTLNGPFQKIEDIINVKGIGPKTFENMKNEITV